MDVNLITVATSIQAIQCQIVGVHSALNCFISFIYAANHYSQRRVLWRELDMHKGFVCDNPWVVMGDVNASLSIDDTSSGSSKSTIAMSEFKECVDNIQVTDINHSDFKYTWNQRPKSDTGILKKIDRVEGHHMSAVVKRMRSLKKRLRVLAWEKGNLHTNVVELRGNLNKAQLHLDKNPHDVQARERVSNVLKQFNESVLEEQRFLKQKENFEWLRVGDNNSSYFYKTVKGRINRSRVNSIRNQDDIWMEGEDVARTFVDHYKQFLGQEKQCNNIRNVDQLFTNHLSREQADHMIRQVSDQEVKNAMFDIGDNKSPGPDGYSSVFFKEAWDIVGEDVTKAVKQFFTNDQLLMEINHTILSLLLKVQSTSKINDYRPISCCNTIYKCISKVIVNRISGCLKDIVGENQSAFISGR
ncbi:uncharacterized protein [Rutidosis leptorrhynchoides]|uniref:uncharacterized protein n=1 Tax=Rutidosis leptorrhynchoides TaxID=125765 RepID=UPI003A9A3D48